MSKLQSLAVGMGLAIILPAAALAQCDEANLHEAHFSGHSQHASAAGTFAAAEVLTAYEIINTTQVNPWYPWDQANFQYTLVLSAPVTSYANIPIGGGNFLRQVTFGTGSFAYYEDAGTAADYANTATFTDGALILSGSISNMYAEGLVNGVTPENLGVTGDATITGGSAIGDVLCTDLLMNDFLAWLPATSPAGYKEAYDSKWECCVVTSTDAGSWGRVKGLYR
jgi:hypothetical protein